MTKDEQPVLAWHFLKNNKFMCYDRSSEIARAGKTYSIADDQVPELCKYGMHGSIHALDAVGFAPGSIVCRVEISGDVLYADNKLVGRHRKVLWMADASDVLTKFSKWCVSQVISQIPDPNLTRKFLESGNKSLMAIVWENAFKAGDVLACDAAWKATKKVSKGLIKKSSYYAEWVSVYDTVWAATNKAITEKQREKLEEMLMTLAPEKFKC